MSPMVSESYISPDRDFTIANEGTGNFTYSLNNGIHKTQYGFRSGPLGPEEMEMLSYDDINHGNQMSVIAMYDEVERPGAIRPAGVKHRSRAWPVNDRDYTQYRFRPTGFTVSADYRYKGTPSWTQRFSTQGAFGCASLLSGYLPPLPSASSLESIAGKMLRNSRPPKRGFDLARFAIEQREAPLLFKASNYLPKSRKELGGAYLNFLFGLRPTGSDLGALADLVINSDKPIRDLLDHEKVREKRYGTRVLYENDGGGSTTLASADSTPSGGVLQLGSVQWQYAFLAYNTATGNYANILKPRFTYSYTRKQLIRTFATWEYFIPRPHEFHGRLASYRKKAELVLSAGKMDESTVYELAPWTWLADWFVDFGGLLRYQRDVVDNQIVATGCGYSIWEEFASQLHYTGHDVSETIFYAVDNVKFTPAVATVAFRRHKRRSGNPYSISPTWSLTNQQWAILGALGMSRGAGNPIKR